MNILILTDDKWHPTSVVKDGLFFLDETHKTFWATDLDDTKSLNFDLIILAKLNHKAITDSNPWMTEESEQQLCHYVKNGGHLFVIHAGTAEYDNYTDFRNMLGGVFDHHPEQCLVTYKHENWEPYTVQDEHYFMTLDRDDLDIFMTAESEHGIQPAGWNRTVGKGKVTIFTPGHNLDVWENRVNRSIIEGVINGI